MMKLVMSLLALVCSASLWEHVDTRIGTGGNGWGIGQTNPGPQVPFGAMRLGPDTSEGTEPFRLPFQAFGGYWYGHKFIVCFSHTHMVGSGEGDFQNFGVMVARSVDPKTVVNNNFRSLYSHNDEVALPGYYAVELQTAETYAELAIAGTHSGMHRYTCRNAQAAPCVLYIDICHVAVRDKNFADLGLGCKFANILEATVSDEGTVTLTAHILNAGSFSAGSSKGGIDIYFHAIIDVFDNDTGAQLSAEPSTWVDHVVLKNYSLAETTSGSLGMRILAVGTSNTNTIRFHVRSGISFVSPQLAKQNLIADQVAGNAFIPFEDIVGYGQQQWESLFSRVAVTQPSWPSWRFKVYYSAVYRSHLAPTTYNELDGSYMGMDFVVRRVNPGRRHLSDLSLWDIYRTQVSLLILTSPNIASDLAQSMHNIYLQDGTLPIWVLANVETGCMVGHHSAIIFADIVQKNVAKLNVSGIYAAVKAAIAQQNTNFGTIGYIPVEQDSRGAAVTLDLAIDSSAAARLARFVGDTKAATYFDAGAQAYKNVWDNTTQYPCPRFRNGTFMCPWWPAMPYPFEKSYVEGNAAQYRWYVPHDLDGLVGLFDSPEQYASKLHNYFNWTLLWPFNTTLPDWTFWAGNEPSILNTVQFNAAGPQFAHLTQYWFPLMLDTYYTPWASGVPGNDDYGCMSAYAVWGYWGLYPIPPTTQYAITTPMVDNVTVVVGSEQTPFTPWRKHANAFEPLQILRITAVGRPASGPAYIQSVTLNGVVLTTPFVSHKQLLASAPAVLSFTLGSEPCVFGQPPPSKGGPQPFVPPATPDMTPPKKVMDELAKMAQNPKIGRKLRQKK